MRFRLSFLLGLTLALASQLLAAPTYEVLAGGGTNATGVHPLGGVVRGPDGNLYGTTSAGGAFGGGTVFKLTSGGTLTGLVSLSFNDGKSATGLLVASDGNLYGTTQGFPLYGQANSHSTIFRLTLDGKLTTLASFLNETVPVVAPQRLMQASDGNLYGTTLNGGAQKKGSIFKLTLDGTFTTLYSFNTTTSAQPFEALAEGDDHSLYGTTWSSGTVFRITPEGALTTLATIGSFPESSVTKGPDGNFYGVTSSGGANFGGAAFKVTPGGIVTTLAPLPQSNQFAPSPLALGDDGNFYGTIANGGGNDGAFYRVTPAGQLTELTSFPVNFDPLTGAQPEGPLLKSGDGGFYGTTFLGGLSQLGNVYKISQEGAVTPLAQFPTVLGEGFNSELIETRDGRLCGTFAAFDPGTVSTAQVGGAFGIAHSGLLVSSNSFSSALNTRGSSRLLEAPSGKLYGTVISGGRLLNPPPGQRADGFIYRVNSDGSIHRVYSFTTNPMSASNANGSEPYAGLTLGPGGMFYGTTSLGGANGGGTFFKIGEDGVLTTLASFNSTTGKGPSGDLIFKDSFLYGKTSTDGANNAGTFFKATPDGAVTALVPFSSQTGSPAGRLVLGRDGNFYGVTTRGGANDRGALLRITPEGTLSTIASFSAEVGYPALGVIEASDGNFYGVARDLPPDKPGTIFRVTPAGAVTTVFTFDDARGRDPLANLFQGTDSAFYGTTGGGGPARGGVVYRFGLLSPANLVNISTRLRVLDGDNVLIGGFIVTGTEAKKIIVRGIGPSLRKSAVEGFLADPTLELHDSTGALIASNDNWKNVQQAEIEATGIPPSDDLESAIVKILQPGSYTTVLRGKNDTTGIGLVEAYDLDPAANSKLANISTRGFVDTGDNVLIGGFIAQSANGGTAKVLVRAIGPSLAKAGVANALQDPLLELHDGNGAIVASDDNWQEAQQVEIEATQIPPSDARESAIVKTLLSGNYTAIVRGQTNTTGVALVEVYNLQ